MLPFKKKKIINFKIKKMIECFESMQLIISNFWKVKFQESFQPYEIMVNLCWRLTKFVILSECHIWKLILKLTWVSPLTRLRVPSSPPCLTGGNSTCVSLGGWRDIKYFAAPRTSILISKPPLRPLYNVYKAKARHIIAAKQTKLLRAKVQALISMDNV